jgi:hypothetical protein
VRYVRESSRAVSQSISRMKSEMIGFLNVRRLPGRLDAAQAGSVLGFAAHDMPELVRQKVIKPLGRPMPNAVKYFSASEVEELAKDRAWLSKATDAIYGHWQEKNRRKKTKPAALPTKTLEH